MIIAFEGPEGSGKGTQIKLLTNKLKESGYKVLSIVEPGGTETGQAIRDVLLNQPLNIAGLTEMFLFSASRAQLVRELIAPSVGKFDVILMDRSLYSTVAYQGYGRGEDIETIMRLSTIAVGEYAPSYVIYLDVPPEIGIARKKSQEEFNRLDSESLEFHHKVRKGYKELVSSNRDFWYEINAEMGVEKVHDSIVNIVLRLLSKGVR